MFNIVKASLISPVDGFTIGVTPLTNEFVMLNERAVRLIELYYKSYIKGWL